MARVLVVDDEESICWGLEKLCQSIGHETTVCSTAEAGLEAAGSTPPDLIVLDVRLPGLDGLNAMEKFQAITPNTPIVIMTAYGELDSAVAAIRNGAFEYLPKPFDMDRVKSVIDRALSKNNQRITSSLDQEDANKKLGDIVGNCPKIQEVFRRIAYAATSEANVLINGESGTGKELAARAIHRYSNRSDKPFVPVNIASLSPTLAESELFGHVRSAFTGADQDREGLLVQANEGTLFLDELADIPLSLQVKLLRCLDQGEVLPIGSNQPVKSDFRVISATHQDLPSAVSQGLFRHDLFFRICAFQVDLPPLRERDSDMILLSEFFIKELHARQGGPEPIPELSQEAVDEILSRRWSGNVRELRNAIEHALILARGHAILPEHLPEPMQTQQTQLQSSDASDLREQLNQLIRSWTEKKIETVTKGSDDQLYEEFLKLIEPEFLSTVMRHFDNQYVAAAKVLGIHRTTLKKKIVDHKVDME